MGLFGSFSFWPLVSNADDEGRKGDSNRKKAHRPQSSWTLVNSDQTNVMDVASQSNTPSPTEHAANTNGPERHEHRHAAPSRPKLTLDTGAIQARQRPVEQIPASPGGNRDVDFHADAERYRKQSWRESRRLTGLKTRFRSRMGQDQPLPQQQQFYAEVPPDPVDRGQTGPARVDPYSRVHVEGQRSQDTCDLFADTATLRSRYDDAVEIPDMPDIPPVPPIPQFLQLPQLPPLPDMSGLYDREDFKRQEVSDGDRYSGDSNMTTSTVRHRASVCPVDKIPLTDRGYVYENPFEGVGGPSDTKNTNVTNVGPLMPDNGDVSSEAHPGIEEQGPPPLPEQSPLLLPNQDLTLSECLPQQTAIFRNFSNVSDNSTWSAHIDQNQAVKQFNDMAYELCLRPVALDGEEDDPCKLFPFILLIRFDS